ncbi:hypothetical protein QTP88_019810 [Uroleucon formosanum]
MCEDYDKVLENKISGYCNSSNKKWTSSKRTLNVFRKYNEKWLNLNFNIALPPRELHCNPSTSEMSLPSTSTASVGRPIKPFIQSSDKTKRRKIKSILNENSNDKIIFATKTILYSDGNRAAADQLKQSTEYSPQRALKIKHTYNNRLSVVKSYTADEVLALIIDAKLTKFSYSMLKKGSKQRKADIYPSYNKIKESKIKCYPDNYEVNEYGASIPLQNLVNHTAKRLLESLIISDQNLNEFKNLHLHFKWGCDGSSGHSEYHQKFIETKVESETVSINEKCDVNLNLRDSAKLVIREVIIFWEKARIPVREEYDLLKKVESLYNKWRNLQKHSTRKSAKDRKNEEIFVNKLNDIFDIVHARALDIMKIECDKQFLIAQRTKGRPGCLLGIDRKNQKLEECIEKNLKNKLERKKRVYKDMEISERVVNSETVVFSSASSDSDEIEEHNFNTISEEEVIEQPNLFQLRGKTNFITDKMAAALDRCKISDRDAVHILLAIAESFGININELIINRTSVNSIRQRFRKNRIEALRVNFNPSQIGPCVVHWDGKLLPSLSEKKLVDRLPIIISYKGIEQLLGVPELISGTGENQATAVYQALEDWGLTDNVQALCFDTTASNTGRLKGACILLEQKLEREILYLPCRHHILEVVLRSAFEIKIDIASAPDVPIFKRFQKCWPNINVNNFHIGLEDTFVFQSLQNLKDELLIFCINRLKQYQPRDDYKELLELTIIFLGQTPPNGIFFKVPGPIHHARWMSKAIYSIKIFLFRNEFKLTLKENNALRDLCIFIVRIYIKQWFCARAAALAPNMDLQFIKDIILYEVIDEQISKSALKKMCGHLWYLTLEAASLAFFDDKVSSQTKIKMVKAMQSRDIKSEANKRIILKPNEIYDYANKDINDFISIQSSNFFNRFGIPMDFLDLDPKLWNENDQYKKSKELVNNINVVNDIAERGVKLIEDYNKLLTKNEDQKQYLLQVVSEYRQQFPDCKKSTLSKNY